MSPSSWHIRTCRGDFRVTRRSKHVLVRVIVLITVTAAMALCGQTINSPASVTSGTTARPTQRTSASSKERDQGNWSAGSTTSTASVRTLPITAIKWSSCGSDEECGHLKIPLDYSHPKSTTIEMAVERHLAELPSQRIGSLVLDPGGPGGSGLDDLTNELNALTPALLAHFDVVVFDPRGVQRSDAFVCGNPGTPLHQSAAPDPDPVPDSAAATTELDAGMRQYAAACEKSNSKTLPYLGTVNVARDLERLRIALGDAKLTYMGQSYGTLIGELYAEMFPTHLRAMVLDSTIDPGIATNEMTLDQAEGFEAALDDFFAWCASSSCPWRVPPRPTSALLALIRAVYTSRPPSDGKYADAGEMYDAILDGLYSSADWPRLAAALAADQMGNSGPIRSMASRYNTSNSTNADDVFTAVTCLDHPVSDDLASYPHLAAVDAKKAPIFGPLLAWGEAQYAVWPAPPTRVPRPIRAPGAPPILVVGSTGDPATPYSWAVNVAHELPHGILVTAKGDEHVAYFYSQCVRDVVQIYLVKKVPPKQGLICNH